MAAGETMAKRGIRPTINDIARMAGVSKKTVSRVINESPSVRDGTRQAVQAIIRETGYVPDPQARGLAFRRSFLIGLIYDNPDPLHTMSYQQGLLEAMDGSGFELLVRRVDRTSPTLLDEVRGFVERQKLFGVVLPSPVSEDDRLAELLTTLGCRYVRIASTPLDEADRMIVSHDARGAAAAARHLAALGHQRIGLISGPDNRRSSQERRRGFEEGLAEHGRVLDRALVRPGAYTHETGLAAARDLLALAERPTAIFCLNDEMATGAYQAARERGLAVGRDVSIVGFDDAPIASRIWPAMTSIRLPLREIGAVAGEMLVPNALRATSAARLEITPELVVRASTARPVYDSIKR